MKELFFKRVMKKIFSWLALSVGLICFFIFIFLFSHVFEKRKKGNDELSGRAQQQEEPKSKLKQKEDFLFQSLKRDVFFLKKENQDDNYNQQNDWIASSKQLLQQLYKKYISYRNILLNKDLFKVKNSVNFSTPSKTNSGQDVKRVFFSLRERKSSFLVVIFNSYFFLEEKKLQIELEELKKNLENLLKENFDYHIQNEELKQKLGDA